MKAVATIGIIFICSQLFSQPKIIKFKIELTSCFDQNNVSFYSAFLIHNNDSIDITDNKLIQIIPNQNYNLLFKTYRYRDPFIHLIQFNQYDSIVTFKKCIGDSIPIADLEISEINAIADIDKQNPKIYLYQECKNALTIIACKYGYPINTLNAVGKKYKFEFATTGCEIYESRTQAFKRYNDRVLSYLNSTNSKDWINQFEIELIKQLLRRNSNKKIFIYKKNQKKLILNKNCQ